VYSSEENGAAKEFDFQMSQDRRNAILLPTFKVDLHLKTRAEALIIINRRLNLAACETSESNRVVVVFDTGIGRHSDGPAVLRPWLRELLSHRAYNFKEEHGRFAVLVLNNEHRGLVSAVDLPPQAARAVESSACRNILPHSYASATSFRNAKVLIKSNTATNQHDEDEYGAYKNIDDFPSLPSELLRRREATEPPPPNEFPTGGIRIKRQSLRQKDHKKRKERELEEIDFDNTQLALALSLSDELMYNEEQFQEWDVESDYIDSRTGPRTLDRCSDPHIVQRKGAECFTKTGGETASKVVADGRDYFFGIEACQRDTAMPTDTCIAGKLSDGCFSTDGKHVSFRTIPSVTSMKAPQENNTVLAPERTKNDLSDDAAFQISSALRITSGIQTDALLAFLVASDVPADAEQLLEVLIDEQITDLQTLRLASREDLLELGFSVECADCILSSPYLHT
jgi:hypothetical protein